MKAEGGLAQGRPPGSLYPQAAILQSALGFMASFGASLLILKSKGQVKDLD